MIRIDLDVLISKLHPICKHIVEVAAADCITQQHAEVTSIHLLKHFIKTPLCDARQILELVGIDTEQLDLALESYVHPTNAHQSYPSFSPLLVELLQDSWLLASSTLKQETLRSGAIILAMLHSPSRYFLPNVAQILGRINKEQIIREFDSLTVESAESDIKPNRENLNANRQAIHTGMLDLYSTDVTAQARSNKLDPVLCRDNEIDLMIDILCRRRKNNPIIVGEAGVGKSALVEGLAQRIVTGNVPEKLKGNTLRTLDLGAMQAGASIKGEFEKRFKGIMQEVSESIDPIILFIDEAHTLIGAGNQQGGLDVSNLIKPALARGELKTIAATTWSEYKKYFEKDAALSRRFQLVKVDEPSVSEATTIIRGLRTIYEKDHGVLIDDEAIKTVAYLSDRYISGRQLPDKAIDVLDTACARVAINLSAPPKSLVSLQHSQYVISLELESLNRELLLANNIEKRQLVESLQQEYQEISKRISVLESSWRKQKDIIESILEIRHLILTDNNVTPLLDSKENSVNVEDLKNDLYTPDEVDNTQNESLSIENSNAIASEQEPTNSSLIVNDVQFTKMSLAELQNRLEILNAELVSLQTSESYLVSPHVDKKQISAVISDWTGVPVDKISDNELDIITNLPIHLESSIKGQELAIHELHKHLLTSRADLRRPGRPLGAFLLVGPSGVGKTETVIKISELLFGGKQYLTTINMSEFQEKHTVSRLIGSPPGYVGYGDGGVLTEAIRQKPYSVVLLDEVEKAHPDVLNLFYQAFDKGEMADGEGREIDCKNILFFLTSNLGYEMIIQHENTPHEIKDAIYPVLADFFKPALLARMEVIPYLSLSLETLKDIIDFKLRIIQERFTEKYQAKVSFSDEIKTEIINRSTRSENGARMLESIIDGALLPPVSLLILQKLAKSEPIETVNFYLEGSEFKAIIEG